MYTERSLLDAREVRATLAHRTDVLDEVKRLPLLPDGAHVTATLLADYFEVDAVVLRRVVRKHAGELGGYGYRQLQGEELRAFVAVNLPESRAPRRQLGIFTVPAALVLAMVLEGSGIARRVRGELLESVGATGTLRTGRPVMMRSVFPPTGEPLRMVLIDGEPWFVTADVCRILGIKNPTDASRKAVEPQDTKTVDWSVAALATSEGVDDSAAQSVGHCDLPQLNLVSEAGLYTLILKSRKPAARPFQRWVTAGLLPSVRRGDADLGAHRSRMTDTLAEAVGRRLHAVADIGHALDKDCTVMSDGTVHCRHGEMEICVPAPGEDSGPPFGPFYRCPQIERHGIRDSRLERPCKSVKFVEVVRRSAEPKAPRQRQGVATEQGGVRLSVGDLQVHGSAGEIAAVLREMGVVADPRR
jgi:prophage antirepressor-like protein